MLDLARILEAVTAVTDGRTAAVTPKAAPLQACTAVTAVTARMSKGVGEDPTPDHQDADQPLEVLARSSISNRTTRNSRTPSNGAGSAVTAPEVAAVTAVTTRAALGVHRCWRVTLTDGTHLAAVRPEGATHAEMLETICWQFGAGRVTNLEPLR